MNRRDFIKMSAVSAGTTLAGSKLLSGQTAPAAPAPRKATMVAMPICVAPLAGPDLDRILGDMKDRGGVTALFPFMYSHEEHRAGVPERSPGFRGGNYATPHLQYYKDSILTYEDMKAPEFGGVDVLARVIPAAAKHGIKVFPFVLEDNHSPATVPAWQKLAEVDFHGKRLALPCKHNPYYRAWLGGLVEDYARSYDIGGMMWGAERQSGFLNSVGLAMGGAAPAGSCFCEFCQKRATADGIDAARARLGFGEIEKFIKASRAGQHPRDGHFTTFWRILLNYPELLAWENLWVRGRHEIQAELYQRMKAANPALPIGWHIWQNVSFSPFQRAEEDYGKINQYSDFIRPAVYNNVAGERFHAFAASAHGGVFGDLPADETLALMYRLLGYDEAPYAKVSQTGLSAGYVERETRRAVNGLAGGPRPVDVWPGIDIDVPVPPGVSRCTPEGVKAAVKGVFQGGGTGIILSRNYIEMKPENLSAAGDALRELGLV
jgi:hypothetical protein